MTGTFGTALAALSSSLRRWSTWQALRAWSLQVISPDPSAPYVRHLAGCELHQHLGGPALHAGMRGLDHLASYASWLQRLRQPDPAEMALTWGARGQRLGCSPDGVSGMFVYPVRDCDRGTPDVPLSRGLGPGGEGEGGTTRYQHRFSGDPQGWFFRALGGAALLSPASAIEVRQDHHRGRTEPGVDFLKHGSAQDLLSLGSGRPAQFYRRDSPLNESPIRGGLVRRMIHSAGCRPARPRQHTRAFSLPPAEDAPVVPTDGQPLRD